MFVTINDDCPSLYLVCELNFCLCTLLIWTLKIVHHTLSLLLCTWWYITLASLPDSSQASFHMISLQVQDTCFYQIFQDNPQSFHVEIWSNCSETRKHQRPLLLVPTIVNSTVILDIPHLLPNCHITANIHNKEVFNFSSNISFCEFCKLCSVSIPMLDQPYSTMQLIEKWIQ